MRVKDIGISFFIKIMNELKRIVWINYFGIKFWKYRIIFEDWIEKEFVFGILGYNGYGRWGLGLVKVVIRVFGVFCV